MRVLSRLGLVALAVGLTAATARAQWRDPQVPVQGSALQQAFAALGQSIRVGSEQREAQRFSGIYLTRPPLFFIASAAAGDASLSLYNAGQAGSPLFEVLPAPLAAGWRATTTFNMSPPAAIVNLYDGAGQPQGGTTYSGVQAFALGFAVRDAAGTAWSEDALNAGG